MSITSIPTDIPRELENMSRGGGQHGDQCNHNSFPYILLCPHRRKVVQVRYKTRLEDIQNFKHIFFYKMGQKNEKLV